jgi:hypothetical protein
VLGVSFVSALTGVYIKKTGKYLPPIYFGMAVLALGAGLFIDLGADKNWAKIIIYQIIAGIGCGPNFQSPLIALQSRISPKDIATATATFGFTRNISSAISVVIGGVVFQNEMNKKSAMLTTALGPELAQALSGGSAGASVGIVSGLPPAQRVIARNAFASSLKIMWIIYVVIAALGLLISIFIKKSVLSKQHQTTKTGLAAEEAKRLELQEQKRRSNAPLDEEKEIGEAEKQPESGVLPPKEEL